MKKQTDEGLLTQNLNRAEEMDKQVNRFRLEGDKRKKAKVLRLELSLEHTVTCEKPWVQFSVWQVRGGGRGGEQRGRGG